MDDKKFKNSYSEVLEILRYIPKSDYEKIPANVIHECRRKSDLQHQFIYNKNLPVKYQDLSDDTLDILAVLYKKYMASDNEKARIKKYDAMRQRQIEDEKIKKYDADNIFNNRQSNSMAIKKVEIESNDIYPTNVKKPGVFKKIVNFFRKFFR